MRAETLLVHFEQPVAVAAFLLGHLLEYLGRIRVTLGEVFREAHIDAAVFLLSGDRNRQHLAFGQIGEILHTSAFSQFRMILNRYNGALWAGQIVPRLTASRRNAINSRLTCPGCSCCTQWPAPSTR